MWTGNWRADLQAACERGQEQLIATDYLAAAATLAGAEAAAWDAGDYDTLARLYMPLQEARRQIRLRCGEGAVRVVLADPEVAPPTEADRLLASYPQAQLIVSGHGSVVVAATVRRLAAERAAYVETLLSAWYAVDGRDTPVYVLVPTVDATLPPPDPSRPLAALQPLLPPGSVVTEATAFPPPAPRGTPATFAAVSALWERLHAPFLAAAEAEVDPLRRMAAFRRTIAVDPACEFAHQHLSDTARDLARQLARRGP